MDRLQPWNRSQTRQSGADNWWLDHVIAWATRQSAASVWTICAVSVILIGIFDRLTGDAIWVGPFYLLITCLPAWALGWRHAIAFGLGCMAITLHANSFQVYPHGDAAALWNMVMRFLSIAMIIVLVAGFRRSYDREWHRARTDALTGGLSRQALYERVSQCRKSKHWGVLTYIDLDGFKAINDGYGHAAGDDTLRAFASEMRRQIRSTDSFARIGGDEFLVYMDVDTEADGYRLAQQLHDRMNTIPLNNPIRCSMGAMILHPDVATINDDNVNIADRLMYRAKQDGGGICITTIGPNDASEYTALPVPSFVSSSPVYRHKKYAGAKG